MGYGGVWNGVSVSMQRGFGICNIQFQFEKNFYKKKLLVFVSNIQYDDSDNVSEKMKRILILNFGFFCF